MNYQDLRSLAASNEEFVLSDSFEIFNFHFPGTPLLPGAVSSLLMAESVRDLGWCLRTITGLRFRKPVRPNVPIRISSASCARNGDSARYAVKLTAGSDTLADGEFGFTKERLPPAPSHLNSNGIEGPTEPVWGEAQIRSYLPHGEKIVLLERLESVSYPPRIQEILAGTNHHGLDQALLVGTKIRTTSSLEAESFWMDGDYLPSEILSELVAQAAALTLSPFFRGTKPEVALLGCDAEFFRTVPAGSRLVSEIDLTRVKKLGKTANMILFSSQCSVNGERVADLKLNAMANFPE